MARSTVTLMVVAALGVILVAAGCNSGGSTNSYGSGGGGGNGGGGGGGGARIFVSGDIMPNASYTHVFTTAQSIPYYCRYHGGPGGAGMSGTITVTAAGPYATPVRHVYTIVTTSLPSPAINTGDTITWVNSTNMTHTCESDH